MDGMNSMVKCLLAMAILLTGSCCRGDDSGSNRWGTEPAKEEEEVSGTDPYQYPKASHDVIRLMTYNSFYCKGNYPDADKNGFSKQNTDNFARVITALNPDVISIQELDRNASDRGRRNLLNDIATATGKEWTIVFGPAASYAGGHIGPGMLAKKSLNLRDVKTAGLPGNEPRMLIMAEFEHFVFMATHLDMDDGKRKSSAENIVYQSNLFNGKKPVFLAGDLNDSPHWSGGGAAFPALKQVFSIKSSTESTLPGQSQTIDYILYAPNGTDNFDFTGTHVVKKFLFDKTLENLDTVSDHYPVILDIQLKSHSQP